MDLATFDSSHISAYGDPATPEGRAALAEVFGLYFATATGAVAEMQGATSPERVREQAHRAKGASGLVGATGLVTAFADLEARAAAGESIEPEVYDDVLRGLVGLQQAVRDQLGLKLP